MRCSLFCLEWKSSISTSGFLNQYHVMTFWQHSAYFLPRLLGQKTKPLPPNLPRRISLHTPLFTQAVVCDRNSGGSQVPPELTVFSPCAKCERLPCRTLTRRLGGRAHPKALGFSLSTNKRWTPPRKQR